MGFLRITFWTIHTSDTAHSGQILITVLYYRLYFAEPKCDWLDIKKNDLFDKIK